MSDTFNNQNNQTFQNRPEHHLHTDSEALPGPKDVNFRDSDRTGVFDATRNTNHPSERGDSQFGTADSKTSIGAGAHRSNDYPNTPANSRYGEGTTTGAHSALSDPTKPPGAGHKYDTKEILKEVDDRHKANTFNKTNFDSKGADTDNQFKDPSAPGHHGYTSITGSAPGDTQFKPADTTGGPLHFQHALGGQGQDPIWTGGDKTTQPHNTSTLPGQTSGATVPGTTHQTGQTGHHAPLPPTDKTHISGQTGNKHTTDKTHIPGQTDTRHTTDKNTPAHHAASKVPGHDAAVNLKNTTEDRTHMRPSHTPADAKRTDQGVKFGGAPAKDKHAPHTGAETKPGIGDKVIGKTEKVIGKMTKDHALEEKGALRAETGQPRN